MTQVSGDVPQHNHQGNADDAEYDAWLARIQARFDSLLASGTPLFRVQAIEPPPTPEGMVGVVNTTLFDVYLTNFAPEQRQFHNCNACRQFINRFGELVVLRDGIPQSPFWEVDEAPPIYQMSVNAVLRLVRRGRVTGVFYTAELQLGSPVTGIWRHLAAKLPANHPAYTQRRDKTPYQLEASKAEDYRTVARALAEWSPQVLQQAVTLLRAGTLSRSEKVVGAAEWLQGVQAERNTMQGKLRDNVLWAAIATAPDGFCHPRAGMLGTLLDDIAAGKSFDAIKRAFGAKMDPLQYQRPQAAPSSGAIAQAEKLFEQLELAPALRRRFARIDEIDALWRPEPPKEIKGLGGKVFGHLEPKEAKRAAAPGPMMVPALTITWEKFRRTVLPEAIRMEYQVPIRGGFCALVTASDATAPRLFSYDHREDQRNPFSIYVYASGSPPSRWGLAPGMWAKVTAITLRPAQWFGGEERFKHMGEGLVLVLEGAKDSKDSGLAIFPESLRSELHGVRSVIEAFSAKGKLEGREEASACGMLLGAGLKNWDEALRVTDRTGAVLTYKLDRWD